MAKHRNRRARTRAKGKVQLRQLPVHICGSRSSNPEGLSPLARGLIREAASLQACKAQGEIMASHMTVQTSFGWMVRARHHDAQIEDRQVEPNFFDEISERVNTSKHIRRMQLERMTAAQQLSARNRFLREQRAIAIANLNRDNENV